MITDDDKIDAFADNYNDDIVGEVTIHEDGNDTNRIN